MTNTAEKIEEEPEVKLVQAAGVPPRFLSAIIDYFVINAVGALFSKLSFLSEGAFILTFLVSALYFSVGDSSFLQGQTLGRRVMSLRVIPYGRQQKYLGFLSAFWRFFFCYGIIILLAEVPPIYFRQNAVVASSYFLEVHMLAVMVYFSLNTMFLVFGSNYQAIHDRIAGSIVIRGSIEDDAFIAPLRGRIPHVTILLAGSFVGIFLWAMGINNDGLAGAIQEHRYEIENQMPVRISSVYKHLNKTTVHLEYLKPVTPGPEDKTPQAVLDTLEAFKDHLSRTKAAKLMDKQAISFEVFAISTQHEALRFTVEPTGQKLEKKP